MKKTLISLLSIFMIVTALTGCKGNNNASNQKKELSSVSNEEKDVSKEEKTDQEADSNKKDKKLEELVLAVGSGFDSGKFDPKQKYGSHSQHRLTHQSLLKYDTKLNLIGDLAKDYKISEDGLKWIFNIKPNIKFSNGKDLTVDDVIFTYNMLKKDGVAFDLENVKDIRSENENEVIIELSEPNTTFVSQLTEIPIVPKDVYDDNYTKNPIGSGPYVVKEYKEGEQVIMEANPHYEKPMEFKKLTFLLYDEETAFAAAKSGGIDVLYIPASFADQKIENMRLERFESIDSRCITFPTLSSGNKGKLNGVDVEVGNDVTSDISIRKALAYGINREDLINLTMNGEGKPAYTICDGTPWFNEKAAIKDGNIEKAKKILKDGGWEDTDGDGIVEKDGRKAEFDLYYSTSDKLRGDLAIAIADYSSQLGMKINAVASNWDEIYIKGKSNAVLWAGGRHHPAQLYSFYSSKGINKGYNNLTHYSNPVVDGYLDKAIKSSNLEESYDYWKKAQWDGENGFSALGDSPIVWLTRINHLYMINDKVDIGEQILHSHGYEWAIFNNMELWKNK